MHVTHKRPSRAQHIISIQDYRESTVKHPWKSHMADILTRSLNGDEALCHGQAPDLRESSWGQDDSSSRKAPPRTRFSLLAVDLQEMLHLTTWSRYSEATCWSALGECKQGEAELAPCPEAAAALSALSALSVLSGERLLRLFTLSHLPISSFSPADLSRIAWWPWCPLACACHDPGEFVPAGWSVSLAVRLRRCAAAHGGVMATLSWLWGSPRARSHPHAM